ncbi:MAG: hypothetical protein CMH94_10715 [Oceanicaulis sp.]|nr:hypothetical protein [Oceanicaulis sp.]
MHRIKWILYLVAGLIMAITVLPLLICIFALLVTFWLFSKADVFLMSVLGEKYEAGRDRAVKYIYYAFCVLFVISIVAALLIGVAGQGGGESGYCIPRGPCI